MSVLERETAPLTVVLGLDRAEVADAIAEITSTLPEAQVLVLPAEASGVSDLISALQASSHAAEHVGTGTGLPQPRTPRPDRPRLTTRENEVLGMVATGLTCRQIAARLCLSRRTVENHVQRVMRKLAVRNRVELVRSALALGLA